MLCKRWIFSCRSNFEWWSRLFLFDRVSSVYEWIFYVRQSICLRALSYIFVRAPLFFLYRRIMPNVKRLLWTDSKAQWLSFWLKIRRLLGQKSITKRISFGGGGCFSPYLLGGISRNGCYGNRTLSYLIRSERTYSLSCVFLFIYFFL